MLDGDDLQMVIDLKVAHYKKVWRRKHKEEWPLNDAALERVLRCQHPRAPTFVVLHAMMRALYESYQGGC